MANAEDIAFDEEPPEEEECPRCPPVGAPAWMATFADMATLLMAFFVLILSFAEFNSPKFKMISGSLQNAFGVQKQQPVMDPPQGTTVISLSFSPSPDPSVREELTQQTTETKQPNLELKQKTQDFTETKSEGEAEGKADGGEAASQTAEQLAEALQEAIARGDVEIEMLGEQVVVNFTPNEAPQKDLPQLIQQTLEAIDQLNSASGKAEQEVLFGGLASQLRNFSDQMRRGETGSEMNGVNSGDQDDRAQIAEEKLKASLSQQIDKGLAKVERKDGKVIVTVGAGGAFGSGSAELTREAEEIMARIAETQKTETSRINVSGHTDDVPLIFGAQYRDNWDLAAARASSVVQELQKSGKIKGGRMQAVSYGESRPVESNETAEGRSKNRRIEIEINY